MIYLYNVWFMLLIGHPLINNSTLNDYCIKTLLSDIMYECSYQEWIDLKLGMASSEKDPVL